MVLWWIQESRSVITDETAKKQPIVTQKNTASTVNDPIKSEVKNLDENISKAMVVDNTLNVIPVVIESSTASLTTLLPPRKLEEKKITSTIQSKAAAITENFPVVQQKLLPALSTAIFTFSGDCWVNIYDATGERIAWGVKKIGYVMTVTGIAPLQITLGKPELVTIVFNDQDVDMSAFNIGNIAKFTLPLTL